MSVFASPGLYLRNPQGGAFDVAAMRDAGFAAIALNVGDHSLDEWARVIARAESAGVTWGPWARTWTEAKLGELCDLARIEGTPVIVNAEDEIFDGTLSLEAVERETRGLDAALSTLPWAGDLDLSIVERLTVHLQLFPQENTVSTKPRDCRAHAYARGAERVELMLGMHGLGPNSFPPRQGAYWIYTADDMAGDNAAWAPQSVAPLDLPYTGPLYGPSRPDKDGGKPSKTVRALKIACHRAGVETFSRPDGTYNAKLETALSRLQRLHGVSPTGQYGRGTHAVLTTLMAVQPGAGYALGPNALKLIREDAA